MSYSIGITTFKRREHLVRSLVTSIRSYTDKPISIMVNADYCEPFDTAYTKRIMQFCLEFEDVVPTFFRTFTSLSKMWNTIILNSGGERNLILNDDIELTRNIFPELPSEGDLWLIGGGWSHFMISRSMAIKLNFFDERLLAFGEEDGDMTWKYQNSFKSPVPTLAIPGIRNLGEGYRNSSSKLRLLDFDGNVFRPAFNRRFMFDKMYAAGGTHVGMFDTPHIRIIEDSLQYPYEQFKMDNYDNL